MTTEQSTNVAVMIKKTSSLGTLLIKPIEKQLAKEMIVRNITATNGMREGLVRITLGYTDWRTRINASDWLCMDT